MKIKFNSDDDLPLNKPLKFHAMTIIIRSVFEEGGKLYLQVVLDDALMFQKELTLIKQVHQKNVCFVIIGILKMLDLKFEPHVCNKCHDVLMTYCIDIYELKSIAILNVKRF